MSRFGGRFVPNIEHEVRRQAVEPIAKWRQEWVLPTGTSADGTASTSASVDVKILKWVRVPGDPIVFPEEQDVLAEDRIADDAAIVEVPVQSIHNAPVVAAPVGGSLSSVGGGLGTIAPKEPPTPAPVAPASAIPPHMNTISEPTSSIHTADNTPTDSIANTPAATAATEPVASPEEPSPQPEVQPQVESQLHDQPLPADVPTDAQLEALAEGAEAEQPADQDDTLLTADLAASVPATTFEDETPGAGAGAADVEMKDA
ncbi:hypothetical protein PSEUBRA_004654 [Kalmanozyma brasiliensis GHG001]|uniref:Uncharacterized protein n=1 Tax=Kalmanozyma brasiliensis (strain GHG001) TaxID=1365824 RepID=V5E8S8_KALBG|nr:uncharacterized protein PSEUBRA_004654 [Kalmanozyma brasiliensis GHG001]EST06731.1 hypothetical protein PSEUBRA_004654 [Kalmanozyma brasiliensis GHG001]